MFHARRTVNPVAGSPREENKNRTPRASGRFSPLVLTLPATLDEPTPGLNGTSLGLFSLYFSPSSPRFFDPGGSTVNVNREEDI